MIEHSLSTIEAKTFKESSCHVILVEYADLSWAEEQLCKAETDITQVLSGASIFRGAEDILMTSCNFLLQQSVGFISYVHFQNYTAMGGVV